MDDLGRFYTSSSMSTLLVESLSTEFPKNIIDLGIGDASLTLAAFNRWDMATYIATEIEKHKVESIKNKLSFVKIYNYDSLTPNLSAKIKIKYGSIDVAICNPPYIKVDSRLKYLKLFERANCVDFGKLRRITSEIVFFAQNLTLLKKKGELGIILSDSLITGKDFFFFREVILNKFDLSKIIQLPDKIFSKTEARTYILILKKNKPTNGVCNLYISSDNGILSEAITISKNELVERMDYQFFKFKRSEAANTFQTLKDIGATIKRGKKTFLSLKGGDAPFFHSVNFKIYNVKVSLPIRLTEGEEQDIASVGDILMCRVGKRCVGRSVLIVDGSTEITDCVYKISVPAIYIDIVWESLLTDQGQKWLKTYAHGVCAQVISKSDLFNFPLYCLNQRNVSQLDGQPV